ncbi:MAG: histidinol-phosphate transaminase [Bacteroidales bacterium]|nr:histidinol-phosphate transaminase [Bacteroidales bacterium]MBK8881114.1 histidinol-phosphate transaminase [Bacteroidales bacterium]
MVDINKIVRENVLRLTPYSCARDEFQGSTGVFMDANENPYGSLNRYPDPYQKELKAAVARFRGIAVENIFLGNGSDEIIDLCFRIFCSPGIDSALTFTPTYGMYEVSASVNDVKVIRIPLNGNFQIDITQTEQFLSDKNLKLIFICSPNNPTSNSMNHSDVEYLISKFNGIIVIDEAYIDFSEQPSFVKLLGKYPNLIIMQTFSKALGMAAARVGIAFSTPEIIHYFNKVKPPYNMSTINQIAALKKLGKPEVYRTQVLKIKTERDRLAGKLKKIKSIEKVFSSDSNFLLVRVKDANSIYNALIDRNIVVRNRNSVIENCIRITVGKPNENNKLISALKSIAI